MKLLIILLAFMTCSILSFGQTSSKPTTEYKVLIDGKDINTDTSITYIELMFAQKFMSFKVKCIVDFGQEIEWGSDTRVQNADGTSRNFNTVIDGLNFFTKNGWDFVTTYPITIGGSNVHHFLLKRRK